MNIKENHMKQLVVLCFCLFAFAKANSQQPAAETIETVAIATLKVATPTETIKQFFNHFNARETDALKGMMSDKLTVHSLVISESEGKNMITTTAASLLAMLDSLPADQKIEERIIEYTSSASTDHATVTATYEFYSNGDFTHNGTTIFTLFLIDNAWQIVGIADTRLYP